MMFFNVELVDVVQNVVCGCSDTSVNFIWLVVRYCELLRNCDLLNDVRTCLDP